MQTTKATIAELFEPQCRYIVPLFQRSYVWTKGKQWESLWRDIATKASEILSSGNSNRIRNHFMGAVVLSQISTSLRQVRAMDVIDGQQRLTTLQIILTALHNYVTAVGDDELNRTLSILTSNNHRQDQPVDKYKVWPTSTDRSVFEAVVGAKSYDALQSQFPLVRIKYTSRYASRPRLVEAYTYFYDAIRSYAEEGIILSASDEEAETMDDTLSAEDRINALIYAVSKRLEIVVIELGEHDDPQVIFETLNARGEPLLPSDLMRNFVFLEATRKQEDVEELYATFWQDFDTDKDGNGAFWTAYERQGRLVRPRLDLFMFNYVACQTERDMIVAHLFQEFRDWWHSKPRVVAEELRQIHDYSKAFRRFFQPDKTTRLGVFAARLRVMDTSTMYPLLLFLTVENASKVAETETDGMLADLESYVVRRMVCGLTNKPYNRIFLRLLGNLRKAKPVDRAELQKQLLMLDGESSRWPNDAEFEAHWLEDAIYLNLSSSRIAMLLSAIDLQMETSKQEQIHLEQNLSIEHIMPQNGTDTYWPIPANHNTDDAIQAYRTHREKFLHSIGNLTLLTQALNSSVSNGPFAAKRSEITLNSRLRINADLQRLADTDDWDEGRIRARGNELLTVAKMIWKHPGKTSVP